LAERLATYAPTAVVASLEPKAMETGQIVARRLGIPFETAPNLHEHDRLNVGFLGTREEFQAKVTRLLEDPVSLVFGNETGDQAHQRYASAIARVLERFPAGNLVVVSHGTVMSLYVSCAAGIQPVPFWKRLDLPAFAVLSLPDLELIEVVETVARRIET
jgi:broad specificity phosphatase PhoE